jgi:hypothetical protein
MKRLSYVVLLLCFIQTVQAQKFFTREGNIRFYSHASLEDIEATNSQVTSILDLETSNLAFSLLMKGFQFENALMQEHFNEKYLHSDKHPKSKLEGVFSTEQPIDPNADGKFEVRVKGKLTLHGVTRDIDAPASITVSNGKLSGDAEFKILLADYDVKIPSVVKDNIAEEISIFVHCDYELMDK